MPRFAHWGDESKNWRPSAAREDHGMMNDRELLTIVEAEEKRALGWGDGELSHERQVALEYYKGKPYGNEVEGRSQIVTTEVRDTIEWILPSLVKIFTASDDAVEFEPQGPGDEEGAKQATQTCNYVFYRQNPGFLVLYSFFKDALIQKNGYVKVWYEESTEKKREQYQGLTDEQMSMLAQNDAVEFVEHTAYPDPMQGGEPMPEGQMALAQPSMLHDVVITVSETVGKVCVAPVPPEEMLVSSAHNEVDLQESPFTAHRCKRTISELAAMGYDVEALKAVGGEDNYIDSSGEYVTRHDLDEEELYREVDSLDPSMREVWVTEAYIRVDFDGDGIAELRKVTKCGKLVLENEETEVVPFASLTPTINTHRHIGDSVADVVMDLQLIKSMLTRQVLDNIYLTNAPRNAVLIDGSGNPLANLDDLLTVRPGGIVRMQVQGAVTPLTVPFMAQHGMAAMEYFDTVRENRTGVTRYNQGIDANSLNKTASGITQIMTASQQRIELIARIFAETGVKQMFKLVLHCLTKYNAKPMTVRLTDGFVEVDPRNWKTGMDMTINVGLGTGNKDQQLMHLNTIAQAQAEAIKMGGLDAIVTMENVYNVQRKIAENAGFKNPDEFWQDPKKAQPKPPQPDPEMEKAKMDMEVEKYKADTQGQTEIQKAFIQARTEIEKATLALHTKANEQMAQKMIEGAANAAGVDNPVVGQEALLMAAQALQAVAQALMAPKRKVPIRGPDGKIVEVIEGA